MSELASSIVDFFRNPPRHFRRSEVTGRQSLVPSEPGIYGWYFDRLPPTVPDARTVRTGGGTLLYVGIAPGKPTVEGRMPRTLRIRLRDHASGNADGSTLRLTLGCLLSSELGIGLRQNPSGRLNFGDGESRLSDWIEDHARVAWVVTPEPWSVEPEVVKALNLPLNRSHNQAHAFYRTLGEIRAKAKAAARREAAALAGSAETR